jgi:ubiquinone/menaquinone biosynthesis C-methylase UbiE
MDDIWPVRLFNKSVLKKTKYNKILEALGDTEGKHILEIGSDNGVYSYLFRKRGGVWSSADVDERSINAIRELVKTDVYRVVDGQPLVFEDNEFDCVIIVDIIEHLFDDIGFINELYRVLKPGGLLIFNAPNIKSGSILTVFRNMIGMTDANHGHVRPGYSRQALERLLAGRFSLETYSTHTKFFSKFMDTLMVLFISALKRKKKEETSGRGVLVTDKDLKSYQKIFRVYSLIYPFVWMISSLDKLLFFRSGYMFIATGYSKKEPNINYKSNEIMSRRNTVLHEVGK